MIPVFDSTSLKTYVTCPRKFYWRYVKDLIPQQWLDKEPAPLGFGGAIHEALDVWYSSGNEQEALNAFYDNWQDREEETLRTRERGEKVLEKYFERYNQEPFEIIAGPEHEFCINIGGYDFAGRLDMAVQWSGMNLIMDHKTSSRMSRYYYHRFRPDIQMSAYPLAAQKIFNKVFHGTVINVLYFTKTEYDFDRDISYREEWELELTERLLAKWMSDIDSLPKDDYRAWEPRWTSCMAYMKPCPYRDLCITAEPGMLVDTMYAVEQWNPLNRD